MENIASVGPKCEGEDAVPVHVEVKRIKKHLALAGVRQVLHLATSTAGGGALILMEKNRPFKNDLTGKMFGSLYVRKYGGKAIPDGETLWECRCYATGCYRVLNIRAASIVHGFSKTCGCSMVTHGLTRGPRGANKPTEYKSWIHAKLRCSDPNNPAYSDYGGRGIVVCAGWKDDYASFFKDLGPKPPGTSLDRTDNNGNYSCGHCAECLANGWKMNCKWETSKVQARNRRSTVYIEHAGKKQSLAEWAEEYGMDTKRLWDRLYRYKMPVALALSRK